MPNRQSWEWEVDMQTIESEREREMDDRRRHIGWFVVAFCSIVASGFVLWVLSLVR